MKKKKSSGGGANWMDTYGDMVTLLMCFFVLLFSMSTMNEQKIIDLVQAFNPDAIETNTHYGGVGGDVGNPPTITEGEVSEALDQLYENLKQYIASEGAGAQGMSVTRGDGFVFISLNDTVMFEGYSYKLLPDGEVALDRVAEMLATQSKYLDELRVLGHTAQDGTKANNPTTDRFLSSNRASVVLVYLQEKDFMDEARMLSVGYGQWRPVATNDTAEGRAQNRRVEIIVSGLDVNESEKDTIAQYYSDRGTENPMPETTAAVTPVATADINAAGRVPSEILPAGIQTLPRDTGGTN